MNVGSPAAACYAQQGSEERRSVWNSFVAWSTFAKNTKHSWILQPTSFAILNEEFKMIAKVKGGYRVLSSKGKNLGGPYKTLDEAKKRLRQVEFFKRRKG